MRQNKFKFKFNIFLFSWKGFEIKSFNIFPMFFFDDKAEISDSIEMVILLFRNKNRIRVKNKQDASSRESILFNKFSRKK